MRIHPLIRFSASLHAVDVEDVLGPVRLQEVNRARIVAIWLLWQDGHYRSEIGRLLRRHPSSVDYALSRVDKDKALLAHCKKCQKHLVQVDRLADAGRPALHIVGKARKGA